MPPLAAPEFMEDDQEKKEDDKITKEDVIHENESSKKIRKHFTFSFPRKYGGKTLSSDKNVKESEALTRYFSKKRIYNSFLYFIGLDFGIYGTPLKKKRAKRLI